MTYCPDRLRQPLPDIQEFASFDLQVHTEIQSLFVTDKRLETVQNATLQDPQNDVNVETNYT